LIVALFLPDLADGAFFFGVVVAPTVEAFLFNAKEATVG